MTTNEDTNSTHDPAPPGGDAIGGPSGLERSASVRVSADPPGDEVELGRLFMDPADPPTTVAAPASFTSPSTLHDEFNREYTKASEDSGQGHCTARLTLDEVSRPIRLHDPGLRLDGVQIQRWATDLAEHRIIILSSASPDVARAAYIAICRTFHFDHVEQRRGLDYARAEQWNRTSRSPVYGFELCILPLQESVPSLVVAEIEEDRPLAHPILDALFSESWQGWRSHQAELENLGRHLIVFAPPDLLERMGRHTEVPCHHVDFVRPMLLRWAQGDVVRCQELVEQYQQELATTPNGGRSQRDLYHRLHDRLRLHQVDGSPFAEAVSPDVSSLPRDPLVKACTFVATFFPRVSTQDFEELVLMVGQSESALLSDDDQEASDGSDGRARARQAKRDYKYKKVFRSANPLRPHESSSALRRRWARDSASILDEAGLVLGSSEDAFETALVDNTEPCAGMSVLFGKRSHRALHRSNFATQDHFFFLRSFELLRTRGFLFHRNESVVEGFVSMAVQVALSNPSRHGQQWLISMILHAAAVYANMDPAQDSQAEIVRALGQINYTHDRLYRLFRSMLWETSLVPVVESTLNMLIELGLRDHCLEIVRRLLNFPRFDAMRWLRRLLETGGDGAEKAYVLLRYRAGAEASRQLETLLTCRAWCSDGGTMNTLPARAAFHLMMNLCERLLRSPRPLGRHRPQQGRFLVAAIDDEHEQLLPELLTWMVDPRLSSLIRQHGAWPRHLGVFVQQWIVPPELPQIHPVIAAQWDPVLRIEGNEPGTLKWSSEQLLPAIAVVDCALADGGGLEPWSQRLAAAVVTAVPRTQWKSWVEVWDALARCLREVEHILSVTMRGQSPGHRAHLAAVREHTKALRKDVKQFRHLVRNHGQSAA